MKAGSIAGYLLTLAVIGVVIYFFAFEKPISTSLIISKVNAGSLEEITVDNFQTVNTQINNFGVEKTYKSYLVVGEAKTLQQHKEYTMQKVGLDENLVLYYNERIYGVENGDEQSSNYHYFYRQDIECKDNNNGTVNLVEASVWKNDVYNHFVSVLPLNGNGTIKYAADFETSITKVTQKGIFVFIYAELENTKLKLTYDFLNQQFKGFYEETVTVLDENTKKIEISTYEVTYPKEIVMPEKTVEQNSL